MVLPDVPKYTLTNYAQSALRAKKGNSFYVMEIISLLLSDTFLNLKNGFQLFSESHEQEQFS